MENFEAEQRKVPNKGKEKQIFLGWVKNIWDQQNLVTQIWGGQTIIWGQINWGCGRRNFVCVLREREDPL